MPGSALFYIINFYVVVIISFAVITWFRNRRTESEIALFAAAIGKLAPVKLPDITFTHTVFLGWNKREYHFDYGDFYFFNNYFAILGKRPSYFTPTQLAPILIANTPEVDLSAFDSIDRYVPHSIKVTNGQLEIIYFYTVLWQVRVQYILQRVSPEEMIQFEKIFPDLKK